MIKKPFFSFFLPPSGDGDLSLMILEKEMASLGLVDMQHIDQIRFVASEKALITENFLKIGKVLGTEFFALIGEA